MAPSWWSCCTAPGPTSPEPPSGKMGGARGDRLPGCSAVTLPAGWTTRRPTLDDVPAILAVVHAADTFAIGHPDFDAEDVAASLTALLRPDPGLWLAVDPDDTVVGWATVDNPIGVGREFVEVYVEPAHAAAVRRRCWPANWTGSPSAPPSGLPSLTVRCAVFAPERDWERTVRAVGFALVKRYVRMSGSLTDRPDEPAGPPGVTVRPVRPDDEADLREFHRIHEAAFGDTPTTNHCRTSGGVRGSAT
ncbi:hypothetical protein NKG94_29970 [Micromonospora sp. M12]